ncbi:thioredoxin [archaeon SCG-AAA382B04]|nr:thioredoxin [archaeon SCG-AAA382B04]
MSDEIEQIRKNKIKQIKKQKRNKNMTKGKPKTLDESNFEEFTQKNTAVVDAWAEWCGPCKMLNPVIKELAKEYKDKVKFGKLNVDNNQKIAQKFGIRSIPTILFFKNGELIDQVTGALPKQNLKQKIDNNLI